MIKSPLKSFYLILAVDVLLVGLIGLAIWQIGRGEEDLANSLAKGIGNTIAEEKVFVGSWSKLSPQLNTLDNYFLSASTTVEFLETLESAAKQTKTTIKINQAEAKDNLTLNFSIQGSFSGVNQFLKVLENLPYALRIDRVALRAMETGVWQGDFVITVVTQK